MVYGIIGCKYYSIYSCINVQVAFVLRATSGFTNPTPHSIWPKICHFGLSSLPFEMTGKKNRKILERHKSRVNPPECLLRPYDTITWLCSDRVSERTQLGIVRGGNVIGASSIPHIHVELLKLNFLENDYMYTVSSLILYAVFRIFCRPCSQSAHRADQGDLLRGRDNELHGRGEPWPGVYMDRHHFPRPWRSHRQHVHGPAEHGRL